MRHKIYINRSISYVLLFPQLGSENKLLWGVLIVVHCMTDYTCTVLYRDYAHPYCMLQSSYRWDGLNFENSSFASKLSPPGVCLEITPTHEESFLSASEACQLLKYLINI